MLPGPACLGEIADQAYSHMQQFKHFLKGFQANGKSQRQKFASTIETLVDAKSTLGRLLSGTPDITTTAIVETTSLTKLTELAESRNKYEEEAAHLKSLLTLRSSTLPRETLQDALSQCIRDISEMGKEIKRIKVLRKRQEQQAESRAALEKVVKFCDKFVFTMQAEIDGIERAMAKLTGL
ncbi:hypothetical protein QQX98_000428 [Neonectria punicea]|uniref:Uncharacterized protein n=1 Tax=Neonectria punicea TaxID=979145 RepID=A0ABR1HT95_9HYPO